MDELKLSAMLGNALGTGTAVAVLLLILWRVLRSIVERWIASLDNVTKGLAEHTTKDLASHAELGQRIATGQSELRETVALADQKLDTVLDRIDVAHPCGKKPGSRPRPRARKNRPS